MEGLSKAILEAARKHMSSEGGNGNGNRSYSFHFDQWTIKDFIYDIAKAVEEHETEQKKIRHIKWWIDKHPDLVKKYNLKLDK